MIRTDNIIDAGEMDYYAQLKEEYSISKKIEQAANGMTLAEAVAHLANSDDDVKKRFFEHCTEMTVSDGLCAPQEALLVMAIQPNVRFSANETNKSYVYICTGSSSNVIMCHLHVKD